MPKLHYRLTALKDYRNGSIAWPKGMSGNWPKGETRLLLPPVYEQIQRDGGEFAVEAVVLPDPVPVETVDPRLAALAKARAARAEKRAAQAAQEQ